MTFLGMSGSLFLGLLGGLAATLFVLHLLRVRPRQQVVPTLLFWQAARRESRARTVFGRFRHPWTYLLLLAIAAFLLAAIAEPEFDNASASRRQELIILDGGPSLGSVGRDGRTRSARMIDRAKRELSAAGLGDRIGVWTFDSSLRQLAGVDDPRPAQLAALEQFEAGEVRGSVARAAVSLERLSKRREGATVRVFTDRPQAWSAEMPSAEIVALSGREAPDIGIIAARVGREALHLLVHNPSGATERTIRIASPAVADETRIAVPAASGWHWVRASRPASSALVSARLEGDDALAANDAVQIAVSHLSRGTVRVRGADRPAFLNLLSPFATGGDPAGEDHLEVRLLSAEGGEDAMPLGASEPRWSPTGIARMLRFEASDPWPQLPGWPAAAGPVAPLPPRTSARVSSLVVDASGRELARFVRASGAAAPRLEISADLVASARHVVDHPLGAAALLALVRLALGDRPAPSILRPGEPSWLAAAPPEAFVRGPGSTSEEPARLAVGPPGEARRLLRPPRDPAAPESTRLGTMAAAVSPLPASGTVPPREPERELVPWEWLAAFALLLLLLDTWLHGTRRIP